MDTKYISQGLSFDNLKTIHRWLINDYNFENKTGLLSYFMTLVKYKDLCWGLFDKTDNTCIGFALLFEGNGTHIDLFSIEQSIRKKGLGKNFILTLIDNTRHNGKITLNSLPYAITFWKKIGFVCEEHQHQSKNGEIKMVHQIIPKYEKIMIIENPMRKDIIILENI